MDDQLEKQFCIESERRDMASTRMNLIRALPLVFGLALGACGEGDSVAPRIEPYVYCDNPAVAAPSCSLGGYSLSDDSALRLKLEQCATSGCHGTSGVPATTWTVDLSGSVEEAVSSLTTYADNSAYFLIDDLDPDCSQMLSEVTTKPIGAVRMPVTGGFWTNDEIECFRSYLHELFPQ